MNERFSFSGIYGLFEMTMYMRDKFETDKTEMNAELDRLDEKLTVDLAALKQ